MPQVPLGLGSAQSPRYASDGMCGPIPEVPINIYMSCWLRSGAITPVTDPQHNPPKRRESLETINETRTNKSQRGIALENHKGARLGIHRRNRQRRPV